MRGIKEPKKISFPKDETEHNHVIEWWYFNGNLKDSKGKQYSFMNCLFKADLKHVGFPIISNIPLPVKNIYFSHSLLSDISKMKFHPKIDYVVMPSKDSFMRSRLFAKYSGCLIEKNGKNEYRIKNDKIDLKMKSIKTPLLEGGGGFFTLPCHKSSYYYSLTNLDTSGTIKINGRRIKVKGKSWMDHQWANNKYSKDRYNWFSIQLDNNTEILCFEFGKRKMKRMACIMDSSAKQCSLSKVSFKPTGTYWTSPHTRVRYPLSWRIRIPSKKLDLQIEPIIKEQEMLFGLINYWEGPINVKGTVRGKNITGNGFMELVGYPTKLSLSKIVKKEIENVIIQEFDSIKQKAREILD